MAGFIKLHRKITEWGWYRDTNTKVVFIELLLRANFKDTYFMGRLIPRGSIAIKNSDLCHSLNLSRMQIRTALEHLKSTGEITTDSTSKYTLVNVHNYDLYQGFEESKQPADNQQTTSKQPADNQPIEEEVKKSRSQEVKKDTTASLKSKPQKTNYAEFVSMTNDEYSSLVAKLGESGAKRCVEILDNYKGANGKKYASDYRAILNWVIKRYEEECDKIKLPNSTGNPFLDKLKREGTI